MTKQQNIKFFILILIFQILIYSACSDSTTADEKARDVEENELVSEVPTEPEFNPDPSENWKLLFYDDFEGSSLDNKKWSYNYPWGNGHTHNHRAYCTFANITVNSGLLKLKADNKRHPDAPTDPIYHSGWELYVDFTGAMINTSKTFRFTHGYVEARLKMPETIGFWPAFWTLGAGWPPEIDILEYLTDKPFTLFTNYHYGKQGIDYGSHFREHGVPNLSEDFHVFALDWTEDYMKWYIDGRLLTTYTDKTRIAEAQNQYLLLNIAVGGWAADPDSTTKWPAYYTCDWVRVWERN